MNNVNTTNVDSITVRMYNTGSVGDCLFLLFKKGDVTTFTMLIDCGGWQTQASAITACVTNIKKELGDRPIDLVVVTHEHLDHVSGFNQAQSVFDQIEFSQVWMAWTEDGTDPLAKKLKTTLGKKLKALTSTIEENRDKIKKKLGRGSDVQGVDRRVRYYASSWNDVLESLRFESGLTGGKATVADAMEYVKAKSKGAKGKMFKKPGDVIVDMKGAEGVKFFILGPPYDQDLSGIKKTISTSEVYSLSRHLAFQNYQSFLNALPDPDSNLISKSPFGSKYNIDKSEEAVFTKMYSSTDMKWRQIEEDWLQSAGEVAIAVNSYTNNTSLAMAIELPGDKVLLFPADAQSGNWMSWQNPEVMKSLKRNGGKDTNELLANTVFYKVGHHGSHNGTASVDGLDKMVNPDLVAMMPLVQDKVPAAWVPANFPAKPLYTELIKKTNGAVIRTDEGPIKDPRAVALRNKNLDADTLKKFKKESQPPYHEWIVMINV